MENETTQTDIKPEKPKFRVDCENNAAFVLSLFANNRAELIRVKRQAAKRVAELEADYRGLEARWNAELEEWAKQESIRRRRQTVTTLQGDLAFTRHSPAIEIASIEDAITTAKAMLPDAVTTETTTTETLDKKAFLALAEERFRELGEIIPGATRTEARESFAIRLPKVPEEETPPPQA